MTPPPSGKKPLVGVSQCLLGDAVRYDGKSRGNIIVIEQLSKIFQLLAVCPEVEAGLPVPRPAVQLTGSLQNPQLTGVTEPSLNITTRMQHYCREKSAELEFLHGFIFKSRSPSCGLHSTAIFIDRKPVTDTGRGVFAASLCRQYPQLAVIEDTELANKTRLNAFINKLQQKNY